MANLRGADDRIGPMEDVEEQRLQHLRIFPHALEIEALETRETDCVLGIVKKKSELSALLPFVETAVQVATKRIAEGAQGMQGRVVELVEVLSLLVQLPLLCGIERFSLGFGEYANEERQKIQVVLRWRQGKRIDLEIAGFEADLQVRASKQPCKAAKTSSQIEDECVGLVFLQVGDQKIQQEGFSRSSAAENDGVRHIPVVKIQEIGRLMAGFEDREIFLLKMLVLRVACVQREQE